MGYFAEGGPLTFSYYQQITGCVNHLIGGVEYGGKFLFFLSRIPSLYFEQQRHSLNSHERAFSIQCEASAVNLTEFQNRFVNRLKRLAYKPYHHKTKKPTMASTEPDTSRDKVYAQIYPALEAQHQPLSSPISAGLR